MAKIKKLKPKMRLSVNRKDALNQIRLALKGEYQEY